MILLTHELFDYAYLKWYYDRLWHQDRSSIFYITTDLGRSDWILWSTGCLMLVMSFSSFKVRGAAFQICWHHLFLKLYFLFTAVAFSGLMTALLKTVIGRARPRATTLNEEAWDFLPIEEAISYASLPSGHSTTIATFCLVCVLLFPRFRIFWIALALWIGASRMIVGAHFPSDVMAGLIVGTICTWLHARNFARKRLLFEFDGLGRIRKRNKIVKIARREIKLQRDATADKPRLIDTILSKAI